MIKKLILTLQSIFLSTHLLAYECQIDIYGTNQISSETLCKEMRNEFDQLKNYLHKDNYKNVFEINENMETFKESLEQRIKKMGNFSFVHLSPIIYSSKEFYITVDVIESKDTKRLSYFNREPHDDIKEVNSLLKSWIAYEMDSTKIYLQNPKLLKDVKCPVFHCLYGFEHSKLEHYLKIFKSEVPKNKEILIQVLRRDKNPQKRAAAAYLLAFTNDGNDLAKILASSIRDPHPQVRNSVMRVLGELLGHVHPNSFPLYDVVQALDFPFCTDRNKALYVISSLIDNPEFANYIFKHGKKYLVNNLKMKQPNLHEMAYPILKKISAKDYGEFNYEAWEQWASKN